MDNMLVLFLCPLVIFATVIAQEPPDNVCVKPNPGDGFELSPIQKYYSPGTELILSCSEGYSPLAGPRTVVCGASGRWSRTKFLCLPKRCPFPGPLDNGEMQYENTVYLDTVKYTCNHGYTLNGSSSALCQANATWSTPVPECIPVNCGLAPIPEFGMIVYDTTVRGNGTNFGDTGIYKCLPPYVLIGDPRTECTANGTWTETPTCQVVTCSQPENIAHGYMSNSDPRRYDYMETVRYGCVGDYVLDGSMEIFCQKDGTWSEKPSCMGTCKVNIQRGRILYKGKRSWIGDFKQKILHREIISVYCKNKARNCGYAISTQCINGRLTIPECYEEPSRTDYSLYSSSLPSEITQC
ncbi:unnamed protein product [Ophioblennius macclurei]